METTSGNVVSKDKSIKKGRIILAYEVKDCQEVSNEPRTDVQYPARSGCIVSCVSQPQTGTGVLKLEPKKWLFVQHHSKFVTIKQNRSPDSGHFPNTYGSNCKFPAKAATSLLFK